MKSRGLRMAQSFALLLLILILLSGLELSSRIFLEGAAVEGPRREVIVTIPHGVVTEEIAGILYREGLIEHPRLFSWTARLLGADTKLHSGTMKLALGQSLLEVIRTLTTAKAISIPVTVREGLTSMQIAGLLRQTLGIDSAAFVEETRNPALIAGLGIRSVSAEGYLFPDTYYFTGKETPAQIIQRLVGNFMVRFPVDAEARAAALGLTVNQVVTLASIIEWECMVRSEAAVISSVYHNRLRREMLLQADPTVAYALGKGPSRLFYRDLKVDSPYNTYMYKGLPPGAINNPGKRSIEAALAPAQTNYLFFVAQGDGTHAFTTNMTDHLNAKQRLDELRRSIPGDDLQGSG